MSAAIEESILNHNNVLEQLKVSILDQLKEVKMSAAIKKAISNHNNVLDSILEQLKEVNSKYECVDPEDLRGKYGTMNGIIEKKTNEINESKNYIKIYKLLI